MGDRAGEIALPLPRPLPPDKLPTRDVLRLDDGYETSVYTHRRKGDGLALSRASDGDRVPPSSGAPTESGRSLWVPSGAEPAPTSLPSGALKVAPAISPTGGDRLLLPVLYLHGIQSHPGWFVGSAAALADRGHVVYQVTRRGSGLNRADRGHARSADQLLDDVRTACEFVLADSGAAKLHLLGVSWGGKLAAAYAAERDRAGQIASLTLVAPGVVPRVAVPAAVKAAVALSLLACPKRLFDIPLGDAALFTDDEQMRSYLRADGAGLHRATAGFLYASRRLDVSLRRAPRGALAMPVTLLLARRDRIVDIDATRAAVQRLAADRAVVEEFDAAHVLEFEPDPGFLYDALAAAVQRGESAEAPCPEPE